MYKVLLTLSFLLIVAFTALTFVPEFVEAFAMGGYIRDISAPVAVIVSLCVLFGWRPSESHAE